MTEHARTHRKGGFLQNLEKPARLALELTAPTAAPGLRALLPRKGFPQRARRALSLCESAGRGRACGCVVFSQLITSPPVMERHSRLSPAWLLGLRLPAAYWSNKGQRTPLILGALVLFLTTFSAAFSAAGINSVTQCFTPQYFISLQSYLASGFFF